MKQIIRTLFWTITNLLPDGFAVRLLYFRYFQKLPNLKKPRTFNEKIAWRKLFQHNPLFSIYADKIAVKNEIAKRVGKKFIIETLWVGDDPEAIPFDRLPKPYVIKTNHSYSDVIFVKSDDTINRKQVIAKIKEQLGYSHGHHSREWGYLAIQPQVLIEKMIETQSGAAPEDYKFFVYYGRVHFIQVDFGRFKNLRRNIYDRDYQLLAVNKGGASNTTDPVSRPTNLEEMILIAEKIGHLFDFCRVDLYSTTDGVKFGEITFYPGAGHSRFTPEEWDVKFGDPWNIPPSA